MDDPDWLAERFEAHRPQLRAVALEPFGQPVAILRGHILAPGSVRAVTGPARPM